MKEENCGDRLSAHDYRWLLREMWLGCDGRWFLSVAQRYGFEAANEINRSVGLSLARASMRRLIKVAGLERPVDIEELKRIIETGYEVYHPSPDCEIELRVVDGQTLCAFFHRCPVMEKVEKGGGMGNYQCACPLAFKGWMEALGLKGESKIEKGPDGGPPCEVILKTDWGE